jgi:hypothetical protein
MGLRYSGIDSIPEIYVLEEPKKKSKSMKLGFWDRFLLRKYSSRLLILINQISNLERYLKKTKSFTTRCMFIAEIAKLNKEFQKYESKCREIEDGRN